MVERSALGGRDSAFEGLEYLDTWVTHEPVEIAEDTFELRVAKPEGLTFVPGQAMKFCLLIHGEWVPLRTFSISSAPHEADLAFVFRNSGSEFKTELLRYSVGTELKLRTPQTTEIDYPEAEPVETPIVMLAGGVGIAPFMSMLRHSEHVGDGRNFHLLYANTSIERIAFKDELRELGTTLSLHTEHYVNDGSPEPTEPVAFHRHRFDAAALSRFFNTTPPALFLIAGSPGMVEETKQLLLQNGIAADRVRESTFKGYKGRDDGD